MNHRFLSVLGVALLVAAAASFVLYRLMARPAPKAPPAAAVVVAARDLVVGTLIRDADLAMDRRAGGIPAGAARRKTELVGRGVIAAIYRDEIVLGSRLAAKGAGAGLAAMIPEGMRAAAVRVNEVVGVAGFALPGMRVDVLISGSPPGDAAGGRARSVTRTLLQNIEVLSAGQKFQKDAEGKPVVAQVVNLLVTPEQAELLSLASNQTTIQLVLRNPLDSKLANPPGAALPALFGEQGTGDRGRVAPRPVPRTAPVIRRRDAKPAPPPPLVVEVIHGVKKSESRFAEVRP
jgi:pilus assembly protein CpaB